MGNLLLQRLNQFFSGGEFAFEHLIKIRLVLAQRPAEIIQRGMRRCDPIQQLIVCVYHTIIFAESMIACSSLSLALVLCIDLVDCVASGFKGSKNTTIFVDSVIGALERLNELTGSASELLHHSALLFTCVNRVVNCLKEIDTTSGFEPNELSEGTKL
ncbi:hypothetical protein PAQ31011_00774 [Pandoraea aquatica]|uniref:Uncharacterized protein n=1 Tax=Pandoraea aquatica TaxID=2508290 RepID=A0A5E4SJF7_9BURK|nr:hypothetical protein PAQ31011_00774 [Pandoraea aquatica]